MTGSIELCVDSILAYDAHFLNVIAESVSYRYKETTSFVVMGETYDVINYKGFTYTFN